MLYIETFQIIQVQRLLEHFDLVINFFMSMILFIICLLISRYVLQKYREKRMECRRGSFPDHCFYYNCYQFQVQYLNPFNFYDLQNRCFCNSYTTDFRKNYSFLGWLVDLSFKIPDWYYFIQQLSNINSSVP